jgi:prepilin-type N-terminal cleavage/methylation domain-containing protein
MIPAKKNLRSEAGFTLVELAIVMIIIGLLIAGVLKGQALIANGTPLGGEGEAFFPQLAVASLITGIQPGATSAVIGQNFPAAKVGTNGIQPGTTTANPLALAGAVGVLGTQGGLFLAITPAIGPLTAASTGLLPNEAFRIDTKLDDGSPGTGDVVGIGTAGVAAGNCGAAGQGGQYATGFTTQSCGLYIHVQG